MPIYLDPSIFACPKAEEGREAFDEFLNRLLLLRNIWKLCPRSIFALKTTAALLFESGRYPLWTDLTASLKAYGNGEIQGKDIIVLVDEMLNKVSPFEECTQINAVVCSCSTDPECQNSYLHKVLLNGLHELLVMLGCYSFRDNLRPEDQILASSAFRSAAVSVKALAHDIEDTSAFSWKLPHSVETIFPICSSHTSIKTNVSGERLWAEACDAKGYSSALSWAAECHSCENPESSALAWCFGPDFVETIKALGFNNEHRKIRILVRSMIETLFDLSLPDTHWLRTHQGGGAPQVERGDWKAWRRDIDYEYHLHYWKSGNRIEFSRVVLHNDMSIT